MNSRTLSAESEALATVGRVDHLYLIVAGGVPAVGARWSLAGVDRVEIGRGAVRGVQRTGSALRVDCPDAWMSSAHVRFERERAHWVAVDAGSRNGILVGGAKVDRAVVIGGEIVEAGRSFFAIGLDEPQIDAALEGPLATLLPDLAARFAELARIAQTRVPVAIHGATGTGKERVAQAIHAASGRRGAFVPVNCGALPAGLVESELFGHRRGAFSGAVADAPGLVLASDGGTLFLDEIGDLPAPAQAALLRALEEHEVRAVGATGAIAVDLRVVVATHHDLDELVATGRFREDLFARLAGFELELPSLAERRVDLGAMLAEIVPRARFAAATVRALLAYAWPRNMRELVHAVERAAALAGDVEIAPSHLPPAIASAREAPVAADARRDELVALLEKHRGNISKVAEELGRARQQVQRWLKRYAIDAERYR
ncbi:MAG TPA: sigma 54-interacting transcriptional regulator [Kofleriaceae bacterium]|jgi:DNA-binding NtrC family response regulator